MSMKVFSWLPTPRFKNAIVRIFSKTSNISNSLYVHVTSLSTVASTWTTKLFGFLMHKSNNTIAASARVGCQSHLVNKRHTYALLSHYSMFSAVFQPVRYQLKSTGDSACVFADPS
jgi:hypothetical protein